MLWQVPLSLPQSFIRMARCCQAEGPGSSRVSYLPSFFAIASTASRTGASQPRKGLTASPSLEGGDWAGPFSCSASTSLFLNGSAVLGWGGREGGRAGGQAGRGREECGKRKEKKNETARGRERCHWL